MSKLISVSEEMIKLVDRITNERTTLNTLGVKIEVVGVTKLSKGGGVVKVQKASEIVEFFTQDKEMVILFIYERFFDRLGDDTKAKEYFIESALSQIAYDSEKDKIEIGAPSIVVPLYMYRKHNDYAITMSETEIIVLEEIKREDEEAKNNTKKTKKKNR